MSRPKKEGTHLNIILRQDIYDKFCLYAEDKGQTKTKAIERMIERVLEMEGFQKDEKAEK